MTESPPDRTPGSATLTIDQHVGQRVRIVRTAHGLSTRTVSRALDVPVDTVTRWENGSLRIPAYQLLELSQLMSCPLTRFFDDFPLGVSSPDELDQSESYVNAIFDRYPDPKH